MDSANQFFDVAGPPDTLPIVFVHGAAWTRKMWLPQMEALSADFRVVAVDLPGHGALREQPFGLASAVQTVMDGLRSQTSGRALIVGLSLGGYVAMACARDYSQEIAALVLSGCSLDYRGIIGDLAQLDSRIVTALFSEKWLSQMQAKTLRNLLPEALVEPQVEAGFTWKAMPRIYSELAKHNFPAMLRYFLGPVLILNGEYDKLNRKGEARLLSVIPDGKVQIIESASHICNLEQPEAFTSQVRAIAQEVQTRVS
jgi:pimeloyl-ACP methyl ester carboxylesterase